ncbi:MAG TPA: TlpA disulfide reductase family protein [Puia sp.]|jgi:thiol-disulfide isomerase/thioredoxin|nr:TlpA disulfide reductase family protein [Puia sp.]
MGRQLFLGVVVLMSMVACTGGRRELRDGQWRAYLERKDGNNVVFNFEVKDSAGRKILYMRNAGERVLVDSIRMEGDSVLIRFPLFESQLRGALTADGNLEGVWIIHLADSFRAMPFKAVYGEGYRFAGKSSVKDTAASVDGRWAVVFRSSNGKDTTFRVGEFRQTGKDVTGTFLDAGGDLRYLEGIMDGDTLRLSTFDGSTHAYYFTACERGDSLVGGKMYAGPVNYSTWSAVKDPTAHLEDQYAITKWKNDVPLAFTFKDLDGQPVSFSDRRFKGKVVLLQIMGSWCPNCMDETQFLSKFYDEYRSKGVEIVSLAYERSTDFERSQKAVRAFKQRFDVKYPMLITGVTVTDPQRAAKTLPQLDDIHDFPTTIFVGKSGKIERIHTGFSGPGTGEHYEEQKKEFNDVVNKMLAE